MNGLPPAVTRERLLAAVTFFALWALTLTLIEIIWIYRRRKWFLPGALRKPFAFALLIGIGCIGLVLVSLASGSATGRLGAMLVVGVALVTLVFVVWWAKDVNTRMQAANNESLKLSLVLTALFRIPYIILAGPPHILSPNSERHLIWL